MLLIPVRYLQDRDRVLDGQPETNTGWKRRASAASLQRVSCIHRGWSRRCNAAAARQRGNGVGGVHRAVSLAGTHDGVHLIDEQNVGARRGGTSCNTPFRRSSDSPRYFAPAIIAPMSRRQNCPAGSRASPLTMRCARPSTIAVLPTPGSPISTGLFLVRRGAPAGAPDFLVATDAGSILPSRAAWVRSRALSSASGRSRPTRYRPYAPCRGASIAVLDSAG